MLPVYQTVRGEGTHEIAIQKSRFIAHVARAESEAEAQAFIQRVKKQYWDATHNCYAYLIGEHDLIQKSSDDGEPSGTAGVPILEVLKKRGLKDTVIVVTRYFGGIKLGAGGLIRAYGGCASEGLNAVGIVERQLMRKMLAKVDYTFQGRIENELRNSTYLIKQIYFTELVTFEVLVPDKEQSVFIDWLTNLANGKILIAATDLEYVEHEK